MNTLVFLSFATDVPCGDRYCPTAEYGQHSHTLYNVYGIDPRFYSEGMSDIDASESATDIRPYQSAPVLTVVKETANV